MDEHERSTPTKRRLLAAVTFLLLSGPLSVNAKPIEFVFTGVVASVEHSAFPTVNPGDLVVGKYVFESTTPDSDPNPTQGLYLSPGTFDAKIGTLSFSFPLSFISVLNHLVAGSDPPTDRYQVGAQSGNTLLELTLFDAANQNPFTNDSLPLLPPPLGLFDDSKLFQVFVRTPPNPDFISKTDSNLTTLVAPEPSALILLGSSFALLVGVTGWRKRQ
jgi:hypothetical protein